MRKYNPDTAAKYAEAIARLKEGGLTTAKVAAAVSYTHLDVYKRQAQPPGRAHNYGSEACSYSGLLTDAKSQYSTNEWVVYAITERSNNIVTIADFICMLLQIPF